MSKNLTKLGQRFLNESIKEDSLNHFEILNYFLKSLEEKEDPTSEEIKLVEDIYNFIEKRNILQESMKKYIRNGQLDPESDTLSRLLDRRNKYPW